MCRHDTSTLPFFVTIVLSVDLVTVRPDATTGMFGPRHTSHFTLVFLSPFLPRTKAQNTDFTTSMKGCESASPEVADCSFAVPREQGSSCASYSGTGKSRPSQCSDRSRSTISVHGPSCRLAGSAAALLPLHCHGCQVVRLCMLVTTPPSQLINAHQRGLHVLRSEQHIEKTTLCSVTSDPSPLPSTHDQRNRSRLKDERAPAGSGGTAIIFIA